MSANADDPLPSTRAERMGWASSVADDTDRVRARFDAWSGLYDDDVIEGAGWNGPRSAVETARGLVPFDAEILDAGAGTGLVGEYLTKAGYLCIDATDISPGMLAKASERGIYRRLFHADLKQALPLDDSCYDAVFAIGVSGYIHPGTLSEFARVLRPAGHLVYSISEKHYSEHGFADETERLTRDGRLVALSVSDAFASLPQCYPKHYTQTRTLRRL